MKAAPIIILSLLLVTFVIQGHGEYTQHRHEAFSEDYDVDWDIDYDLEKVLFNVAVRTEGFVGFGISPNGGMAGADIFIAGVYPNGTTYASDRYGTGPTTPAIDDQQDWELIDGSFNGTHTLLSFSRIFDSCDDHDLPLTNDTTNFIWSFGATDEISYHFTNRGTVKIRPLDPPYPEFDLSQFQYYEIKHNMTMPSADTTYWCTIERSPLFTSKHHIVAFDPILNTPEALAHTHHYAIFKCTAPDGQDPQEFFEPYVGQPGGECKSLNPVIPAPYCQTMFYTYAVGAKMTVLPDTIGSPIGEVGHEREYYMFEIHYNNPQELEGITFETGAKIYYTDKLRENDAGLMTIAHHTSLSLLVPPNSEGYKTVGHCDAICTQNYFPPGGINVFGILQHSHLAGRKMKIRHFRGDQELAWPANDEQYDFEYQVLHPLSEEIKILPGDHLTTECTYNNKWHSGVTIGGLATTEEMCQTYFWHYPRAELRDCRSEYPLEEIFKKVGIQNTTSRGTLYEDVTVTSPPELEGLKFTEVMNSRVNWTQDLLSEFQSDSLNKPHSGVCWTLSGTHDIPVTGYPPAASLNPYVPISKCSQSTF